MADLTLAGQSITVEIRVFGGSNFPRERIGPIEISQSRWGATLLSGQSFEAKHVWNVDAIVREPELLLLQDLYDLFQIEPYNLTVTDRIRAYTEPTPRTRPLASGTTATTIGGRVRYFAQFTAGFTGPMEVTKINDRYQVTFQLLELDKLEV